MTGPVSGSHIPVERAARILERALAQSAAGPSLLEVLGGIPTLEFTPSTAGRLFRAASPARLAVGDWVFRAVDPAGTRLEVSHVVREVPLKTTVEGPTEAGGALARALFRAAHDRGPVVADAVEAVLFGIEAVNPLS
jgi:hypothetical protein